MTNRTPHTDYRGNSENLVREFAQITHALKGIDLPQEKDIVVEYARRKGAEEEVLSILEALPAHSYETMADIISAAGRVRNGSARH